MSSYAEVANRVETIVAGLSGLSVHPGPFRPESLPNRDGLFIVIFEGGDDSGGSPAGDDVGETQHEVAVQFLQLVNPRQYTASRNTALNRIEGIRNALTTVTAFETESASAVFDSYDLSEVSPNHLLATVGFVITHTHMYD